MADGEDEDEDAAAFRNAGRGDDRDHAFSSDASWDSAEIAKVDWDAPSSPEKVARTSGSESPTKAEFLDSHSEPPSSPDAGGAPADEAEDSFDAAEEKPASASPDTPEDGDDSPSSAPETSTDSGSENSAWLRGGGAPSGKGVGVTRTTDLLRGARPQGQQKLKRLDAGAIAEQRRQAAVRLETARKVRERSARRAKRRAAAGLDAGGPNGADADTLRPSINISTEPSTTLSPSAARPRGSARISSASSRKSVKAVTKSKLTRAVEQETRALAPLKKHRDGVEKEAPPGLLLKQGDALRIRFVGQDGDRIYHCVFQKCKARTEKHAQRIIPKPFAHHGEQRLKNNPDPRERFESIRRDLSKPEDYERELAQFEKDLEEDFLSDADAAGSDDSLAGALEELLHRVPALREEGSDDPAEEGRKNEDGAADKDKESDKTGEIAASGSSSNSSSSGGESSEEREASPLRLFGRRPGQASRPVTPIEEVLPRPPQFRDAFADVVSELREKNPLALLDPYAPENEQRSNAGGSSSKPSGGPEVPVPVDEPAQASAPVRGSVEPRFNVVQPQDDRVDEQEQEFLESGGLPGTRVAMDQQSDFAGPENEVDQDVDAAQEPGENQEASRELYGGPDPYSRLSKFSGEVPVPGITISRTPTDAVLQDFDHRGFEGDHRAAPPRTTSSDEGELFDGGSDGDLGYSSIAVPDLGDIDAFGSDADAGSGEIPVADNGTTRLRFGDDPNDGVDEIPVRPSAVAAGVATSAETPGADDEFPSPPAGPSGETKDARREREFAWAVKHGFNLYLTRAYGADRFQRFFAGHEHKNELSRRKFEALKAGDVEAHAAAVSEEKQFDEMAANQDPRSTISSAEHQSSTLRFMELLLRDQSLKDAISERTGFQTEVPPEMGQESEPRETGQGDWAQTGGRRSHGVRRSGAADRERACCFGIRSDRDHDRRFCRGRRR